MELFDFYRMAVIRNDDLPPGDVIHYLHVHGRDREKDIQLKDFTGEVGKIIVNALMQFLCPGLKY